jgi:hypothetical protein
MCKPVEDTANGAFYSFRLVQYPFRTWPIEMPEIFSENGVPGCRESAAGTGNRDRGQSASFFGAYRREVAQGRYIIVLSFFLSSKLLDL